MWILGLETATWTGSVAVSRDSEVVAERTERTESSHAPIIVSMVDEVLRAAGIDAGDLDAVAVSAGPGSFTGLRIGLSTAKGLAYATNARIVAVPTLVALARAAGVVSGTVCTILDARKGEVYAACFRWREGSLEQRVAEQAIAPHHLDRLIDLPCTFLGDGVDVYGSLLIERFGEAATLLDLATVPPSAGVVAQIGWERLANGSEADLASLEPNYVRPSEAEQKAL